MYTSYKRRFGQMWWTSPAEEQQKSTFLKEQLAKAEMLAKKTHFNSQQVLSLFLMHQSLVSQGVGGGGKMDRLRFREVLHTTLDLTDDVMLDRIFRAFDSNNDSIVDDVEWVTGLSILVKGSDDERLAFCWYIYDINADSSLAREELYHCLKTCLLRSISIDEDVEESIKDIVEMAMKKLDVDKNGQITFPDFEAAVGTDPFLLEAIGPCLPSPMATAQFLESFQRQFPVPNWKTIITKTNGERRRRESLKTRRSSVAVRRPSTTNKLTVTPPKTSPTKAPSPQTVATKT